MPVVRDQVFISYSHKDREWLSKLQTMLKAMVRNKIVSIVMAIASLIVTDYATAQIPNTWTREQLIHLYGSRAVNIERIGSQISSISFIKEDPHSFHGGECFCLIVQVLRGREFTHSEWSQDRLPGITVVDKGDDTIWVDSETGCAIDLGGSRFMVTKNGKLILTAYLKSGSDESELVLKAK
jgi:hypothetical protein